MNRVTFILLAAVAMVFSSFAQTPQTKPVTRMTFCCPADNDLFLALGKDNYTRCGTPSAAIESAPEGSAVLILADRYPEKTTYVEPSLFDLAKKKNLRLFVEYPATLPGVEVALPRTNSWERVIVSSDKFGGELPKMRLLSAHECFYTPVIGAPTADLMIARVAGYDTAVFGIPEKKAFPLLFSIPEKNLIVATTRLSCFINGRYAPTKDWKIVWDRILAELDPQAPELRCELVVQPAFSQESKLPRNFERKAFDEAARWFGHAHLLVHPSEKESVATALQLNMETTIPADPRGAEGDGSLGILEGYASGILFDGNQSRRLPLRADCNLESGMVFALDGLLNGRKESKAIAKNLVDFVYFNSGMCAGVRADPKHPAYGLIGWGDVSPAWLVANYGDDNARCMLATALAAAALKSDRWDEPLMRALLANLRTAGKLGFRGDRIDNPALAQNGWRHYHDAETVNYSPHFEAFLWACYLWAYQQTGYGPFLEKARTAISMTMKVYPHEWRWQDNLERAHMLLCLAWLVRVEDTQEHRGWLLKVANDLLAWQKPSGAIYERLINFRGGHYKAPQSNEEYGTGETPLIQKDGDPITDQLYTTGFALLGLHEAVGATGDKTLKQAENKLAEFLCRIQTRSKKHAYLNGTWFRAFDEGRWDYWASSADIGWGAWSIEAGWGQAWTTAVLALRDKRTTYWDYTARSRIKQHLDKCRQELELSK